MDDEAQGPTGYGLVMPFVTCVSHGGPHDDVSYAAGYAMGMLDMQLSEGSDDEVEITVEPSSVPQADLLAMRHGFSMTVTPQEEWSWLQFTRNLPEEES